MAVVVIEGCLRGAGRVTLPEGVTLFGRAYSIDQPDHDCTHEDDDTDGGRHQGRLGSPRVPALERAFAQLPTRRPTR